MAPHELFAPGTEDASTLSPPLGLAYIAAYLRARGHECVIIDGFVESLALEHIAERAAGFDLVGVTLLSVYAYRGLELIRALKARAGVPPVVVGGPHATVLPEPLLRAGADYAVIGEGEATVLDLIEALSGSGRRPHDVAGLGFLQDGQYVFAGRRPAIVPLDQVPMPARELLPMDRYRDSVVRSHGRAAQPLTTTRGCLGTCTFCCKKTFGTEIRCFSVERVVEEFFLLRDTYGVRHVAIYDDNFVTDADFVCAVCDALKRQGFDAPWSVAARTDTVNETVLKALKGAGCTKIEYGVESGSPRILNRINKRVTKDDVRETVRLTKRIGLHNRGFFVLGFPTETAEEMEETIQFALELGMDLVSFTLLTPLPGTVEYGRCLESGAFRDPEYFHHEIVPDFAFPENPLYVPEGMTAEELLGIHRRAYRRYYLRPRMLARRLAAVRGLPELLAMAKGALPLLRGKSG